MLEIKPCAYKSQQRHRPALSSPVSFHLTSATSAVHTTMAFFPSPLPSPPFLQPGCFFLPFYCSSDLATPLWWSPARRLPP